MQSSGKKGSSLYFYCNRSGNFESRGIGKRHLKSQGTSKLNAYCTAALIVNTNKDGSVNVTVHKTHYGHQTSMGHLRISETERLAVAAKLANGVDIQHILDEIRDNMGDSYHRIHLLTRKDITNIKMAFCSGNKRHQDDATSVYLWVEEMKTHHHNPVLLYKPQGTPPVKGCEKLAEKDFILCIQTSLQADILKRFSLDRVSTFGTNGYDFILITIMIVDDYGEGFPAAWCISNREDQLVLTHFFDAIKDRVGVLTPKWFMSDLAEQFYNAWTSTFYTCTPTEKINLC